MADEFAEIHDELRSVAGDVLSKSSAAGEHGREVEWSVLAHAGWCGLEVPDELGGAGATFAEVAIILEEIGRAAALTSYLGGVVLAVGALNALQPSAMRDQLLSGTGEGSARTAVALSVGDLDSATVQTPFELASAVEGLRLAGRAAFAPDVGDALRLLLLARDPTGIPVLVDVAADAVGLHVTAQPVLDETRRVGTVVADRVAIAESAVWHFDGDPETALQRLVDRAAVALACDSLGLSEAMLAATVSYAGVRQQFGRPIGSFQAVKHACADMLVQIAVARQLVSAAVEAVALARPDATTAASMAKSYACTAAVDVAGKAMQLHGGIGYTWESGLHVFLKRAALNRALFGSPSAHRRQLARRYDL